MVWCLEKLIYTYGRDYGMSNVCVICGKEVHPIGWIVRNEYGKKGLMHEDCAYLVSRCR